MHWDAAGIGGPTMPRAQSRHVGQLDDLAFRGVEGVVERLFERCEIGQHGMP